MKTSSSIILNKSLLSMAVFSVLTGCSSNQPDEQKTVDTLAKNLNITYDIVTNHGANDGLACQDLGAEWASCNKVNMILVNQGDVVDSKNWTIYFHSIRQVIATENEQFKITRITGDLHKLEPTDSFDGFQKGEQIVIPVISEYWQLFETDFMPRAFVTAPTAEPKIIASLNTEDIDSFMTEITGERLKRTPDDNNVFATAITRFEKNADTVKQDVTSAVIPTPLKTEITGESVSLNKGIRINHSGSFAEEELSAITDRAELLGINTNGSYPVDIVIKPDEFTEKMAVSGAYKLTIGEDKTSITAFDNTGGFYAMQSMFSLINITEDRALPQLTIEDAPRFEYRGVMVDVARNFHSKEAIIATLDQMAAYKLNKLHLHLTDDEGWRLEIPDLPELTEIGAKRCFDPEEKTCLLPQLGSGPDSDNFGSGYYSRQDYLDILSYAKARNIEVIPEIDMPAHARAAVVSMEARYERFITEGNEEDANKYRLTDPEDTSNVTTIQFYDRRSFINPCMDSSKRFVDKIVSEVAKMHQEAGMPLTTWHFGGDEAKNIKLHAGFQDLNAEDKVAWKGNIDLSKEDKPFARSPQCQQLVAEGVVSDYGHLPSHFAEEVSKIVAAKGIANFQAWQDGLKYSEGADSFATQTTRVNFWDTLYWGGTASVYEWAQKDYDVIVSNPDYVYLDMPYEIDPKERGYYWATRATDTRKMFAFAPENMPQNAETSVDRDGNGFKGKGEVEGKRFYGLSAQLWSESVRTDEQYEYMVFPRVLAAAERAWHTADWENSYKVGEEYSLKSDKVNKQALMADWNRFANVLGQRELAKLEKAGIDYRLPVPGAKVVDGKLSMNVQFPGVVLQYSLDNGQNWHLYDAEHQPEVSGDVMIRSVSATGEKSGRAVTL